MGGSDIGFIDWEKIFFHKVQIKYKVKSEFRYTQKILTTLRGELGKNLFRSSTIPHQEGIVGCSCAYCVLFSPSTTQAVVENGLSIENKPAKLLTHILYEEGHVFQNNDFFNFDLTLICVSYSEFEKLIQAIHGSLLLTHPFQEKHFYSYSIYVTDGKTRNTNLPTLLDRETYETYRWGAVDIIRAYDSTRCHPFWKLHFLTPLNIRKGKKNLEALDLNFIYRSACRRLVHLYRYYIDPTYSVRDEDFSKVHFRGKLILNQTHYIADNLGKSHKGYQLRGLSGVCTLFLPEDQLRMFLLATYYHIGLHCSHGLGAIQIEPIPSTHLREVYSLELMKEKSVEYTLSMPVEELYENLLDFSYQPAYYREVKIRKTATSSREIQLISQEDKFLQKLLADWLAGILQPVFLPQSYAYRSGKSSYQAIRQVMHIYKHHPMLKYILRCDIDVFFDSIPIDAMIATLEPYHRDPAISYYIRMWLESGSKQGDDWSANARGIPQGSPLSPILSNIYLHDFDCYVEKRVSPFFIRYADDIIVFFESEALAKRGCQQIQSRLKTKGLTLNRDIDILHRSDTFEYLGIEMSQGQPHLSHGKIDRIMAKIKTHSIFQGRGLSPKFKEAIEGIEQYYQRLVHPDEMIILDNDLLSLYESQATTWRAQWKDIQPSEIKERIRCLPFFSLYYQKNARKHHQTLYKAITQPSDAPQPLPFLTRQKRKARADIRDIRELLIDTAGSLLGFSKGQLVWKIKEISTRRIPLRDIAHITVDAYAVSISVPLMQACGERNIPIAILDEQGSLSNLILPDTLILPEVAAAQIQKSQDARIRHQVSQAIVINKIKNQQKLIKHLSKYKRQGSLSIEEIAKTYLQKTDRLLASIESLPCLDTEKPRNNRILLLEAQAALLYWSFISDYLALYGVVFEGRETQRAESIVNQMLNYGYGILYQRISVAIAASGLLPHLSFLHASQGAKPTLSWDIVEQYRAWLIDRPVLAYLTMGRYHQQREGRLDAKTKQQLIAKILPCFQAYNHYGGSNERIETIMRLQLQSWKQYLLGESPAIKFFSPKW